MESTYTSQTKSSVRKCGKAVDLTYFKMSFFEGKKPWSTSLSCCLKDASVLQQHVKHQALDCRLGFGPVKEFAAANPASSLQYNHVENRWSSMDKRDKTRAVRHLINYIS